MQHPDLLLQHLDVTFATYVWNRWNIRNIHLKYTCIAIATYATSWSTFATSTWGTCNVPLKHQKHLKDTLATCNVFRCGILWCLQWGATAEGRSARLEGFHARPYSSPYTGGACRCRRAWARARWLWRPAGRRGSGLHAWVRRCPRHQARWMIDQE
jgi:hypothetical protein